jgi:hypothetical protein
VDLERALVYARSAIELAEDAADASAREGYLKVAQECLTQADVDEWFQRKHPTVIIALD